MAEAFPRTLGRYTIEAEIGRGMMGIVYRAHDPALGRRLAVKTVHLALAIDARDRENFERRFEAEARVAAALSHPNIVVVHDVGHDPATGGLFIAFEYLEGSTVAELTAEGRPLFARAALQIAARVADALDYAHAQGVVHRDVKPANVMVLPSGEPKVMDFGVAKIPTAQLSASGEFFGTPAYMAPEQASGRPVDGRSDVFSLGCLLYLMLTGQRAFQATSVTATITQVMHVDPAPPSQLRPDLPPGSDAVVMKALAKRPEDRYPDARRMAEDLREVLAGRPPRHALGQDPTGPGPDATLDVWQTAPPSPRRSILREVLLAGLVALGLAGVMATTWSQPPPLAFPAAPAGSPAGQPPPAVPPPAPAAASAPIPEAPAAVVVAPAPARLALRYEHPFDSATLRVWVDGNLALTTSSVGQPRRRLLLFKGSRGQGEETLELPPGRHLVKVELSSEGFRAARSLRAGFESGATRRLSARVGGVLRKDLALAWSGVTTPGAGRSADTVARAAP